MTKPGLTHEVSNETHLKENYIQNPQSKKTEPKESTKMHCTYDKLMQKLFDCKESSWKPSEKIPIVAKKIEVMKSDLKQSLENSNFDVDSIITESKLLHEEGKQLMQEMEACEEEINNETLAEILKSKETQNKLLKELEKMNFLTQITNAITTSGRLINELDECKKLCNFSRGVENIATLLQLLNYSPEGFSSLSMFDSFKSTAALIGEQLLTDLKNQWDQMISYKSSTEANITTVTININFHDGPANLDVLYALDESKQMPLKIEELGNFLMDEIMVPLIVHDADVLTENGKLAIITIKNDSPKQSLEVVLTNTKKLLEFLNLKLGVEYRDQVSVMQLLGKKLCNPYSEIITKECLIETIPNNLTDLQNYPQISQQIEEFQTYLQEIAFFDNKVSILKYIEDIDVLFSDKCSQYYLETARTIMLKDLSLTMSIGVETIPESQVPTVPIETEGVEDTLSVLEQLVPRSLFFFPRCMISKSTQELLDLVFMMMEQAVQCTDLVCKRIYTTTRLVFELYDAVVPYHHENYLHTIPQYVALFHNNCMYLAHNLLTLGDKWLALMEGRRVDYPLGFTDLVPRLRDLGCRQLATHAQQQRRQLMDSIRGSDLNCISVKDELGENAELAVRQCLRQLQLLKNVWIGVFPLNVFTRLQGTLLQLLVEELVHRACGAEDVSAAAAAQLAHMYQLLADKAAGLFQKPSDVEENVKSWTKLQELILILGGSLKDIEERWDDGKGPLAAHFKTDELRNLIKALFQNTQFRANLLSKMK